MYSVLSVFGLLWMALALVVTALAAYRKFVADHEDHLIHVGECDAPLVAKQIATASRLEWIDKWGKSLTAATIALGLVLGAIALYLVWQENSRIGL